MPCFTTRTVKTDLTKSNWERLQKVLIEQGWTLISSDSSSFVMKQISNFAPSSRGVTIVVNKTEMQIMGMANAQVDVFLAKLKRLYAEKTVAEAATKFGFKVQQRTEQNNNIHLKMRR